MMANTRPFVVVMAVIPSGLPLGFAGYVAAGEPL